MVFTSNRGGSIQALHGPRLTHNSPFPTNGFVTTLKLNVRIPLVLWALIQPSHGKSAVRPGSKPLEIHRRNYNVKPEHLEPHAR